MQHTTHAGWRLGSALLVLLCGLGTVYASAQEAAKPAARGDKARAGGPTDKRIAFEMRDAPWKRVLEFLADESQIPVISPDIPQGSFTYINPTGRKYTIPEVVDLINEGLLNQKFVLVRRNRSFTLISADKTVDPVQVPRLSVDELPEHGNTELAQVILPCGGLVAEELAPEVKKMMGPFREVAVIPTANQLVLLDTVGNIKRIHKMIKDIQQGEGDNKGGDTWSHKCDYILARDAAARIRDLLGEHAGQHPGQPGQGQPQPQPQPPPQPGQGQPNAGKNRPLYVTADERTNTVFVNGPANKIAAARVMMKDLDVPAHPGQQKLPVGSEPLLKSYTVTTGQAFAMANALAQTYQSSDTVRIQAASDSTVIVYAYPADQMKIARDIIGSQAGDTKAEVIPVADDPSATADTLIGMFGDSALKVGAPYIKGDSDRNAIIVRGTAQQIKEVKEAVEALRASGTTPSGNVRIISLDKDSSAAGLAEALRDLLRKTRPNNPVKVTAPGQAPAPPPKDKGDGEEEEDAPPAGKPAPRPQLVDPQADKARTGSKNAPISITVVGNRLIVQSDDPEALALATELVRLLRRTSTSGSFEVIPLQHASAADAAKVLDEAFNNANQQNQQNPFFRGFNPFMFQQQQQQDKAKEPRVRIVADTGSNSLLVKANPVDMAEIKRLIRESIDKGQANPTLKTYKVGPLKYASASDIEDIIKDIYSQQMDQNPNANSAGGGRGAFFAAFAPNRNVDANGNPRPVNLTVSVDYRTNSLILHTTAGLYKEIKRLAADLDKSADKSDQAVMFIPLRNLDPALAKQAVDTLMGRHPNNNQQQPFGGFPGGMGGGFRGGMGGFSGGGFGGPGGGGRGFGAGGRG